MESVCTICHVSFRAAADIVATKCGHVFHNQCIFRWFKRSFSCPECRSTASQNSLTRLFFHNMRGNHVDRSLCTLKEQLHAKNLDIMLKEKRILELCTSSEKSNGKFEELNKKQKDIQNQIFSISEELKDLNERKNKNLKLLEENKHLQSEIEHLKNVKTIVAGHFKDSIKILTDTLIHVSSEEGKVVAQRLATYCSVLKRDIADSKEEKTQLQNEITELKRQMEILHADPKKKIGRGNRAGDNSFQSSGLAGSSLARCSRARSDTKKENSVSQYRYRLRSHARVVKRKLDK